MIIYDGFCFTTHTFDMLYREGVQAETTPNNSVKVIFVFNK